MILPLLNYQNNSEIYTVGLNLLNAREIAKDWPDKRTCYWFRGSGSHRAGRDWFTKELVVGLCSIGELAYVKADV